MDKLFQAMMLSPGGALVALLSFWLMIVAVAVIILHPIWHFAQAQWRKQHDSLQRNRSQALESVSTPLGDYPKPDPLIPESNYCEYYAQDANEVPEFNHARTPGGLWVDDAPAYRNEE